MVNFHSLSDCVKVVRKGKVTTDYGIGIEVTLEVKISLSKDGIPVILGKDFVIAVCSVTDLGWGP